MNPFTLKELRQLTRTKSISVSIILFLFASLAIVYAVPLFHGFGPTVGELMFSGVALLLMFVLCLVLPSEVYSRMERERGSARERADLLMLTSLPPSEVVDGKLRAAFALMALFSSAALPFGVLSYLMHGITFERMLRIIIVILCLSGITTHLALVIATFRASRLARRCVFWLYIVVLVLLVSSLSESITVSQVSIVPLIPLAAITLTVCMIMRGYSISSIAPVVTERDKPLRITVLAAYVGWGAWAFFFGEMPMRHLIWTAVWEVVALAIAAEAVAQPAGYSRRMIADLPAKRFLRILFWPFSSGAANGFAFACILIAGAAAARLFFPEGALPTEFAMWADIALLGYVLTTLLAVRLVWRVMFARKYSPANLPVIAVVVFAIAQSIPAFIARAYAYSGEIMKTPFFCIGITSAPSTHLRYSLIAFAITAILNLLLLIKRKRKFS